MNVRLSKTAVPAALVVFALVAGACGSDEQAADGRHGVFEDTEAEFVRCMSTEEVNKTVTVCPDGSQRVVYESGGGYTLTALDENECQTKYWDDDAHSVSREDCGDGSYEENYRDGRSWGRTAIDDQGCQGNYNNEGYSDFSCTDGSGWGENQGDGTWTRTARDADGCTHLESQVHNETVCADGSGTGTDREGVSWTRSASDENGCQMTIYGGGTQVSRRYCSNGSSETIFRGGWEQSRGPGYWSEEVKAAAAEAGVPACQTNTWASGGVANATTTSCGDGSGSGEWFDGLSWERVQTETTHDDGIRETCESSIYNNGLTRNDCWRYLDGIHQGSHAELIDNGDVLIRIDRSNEDGEGGQRCWVQVVSGSVIEGSARSCWGGSGADGVAEVVLGGLTVSTEGVQDDGCTVYTTNFSENMSSCFNRVDWSVSGVMADGTAWAMTEEDGCTRYTTEEVWSETSFCWRNDDPPPSTMRDGTTFEWVDIIGYRKAAVVNGETLAVRDWRRPSPFSMLTSVTAGIGGDRMGMMRRSSTASEFSCSTLSTMSSPASVLVCAALGIEPMFTTEFVPPPIDQAAIDQAAALQAAVDVAKAAEAAAAAAEDAAAQAAAAQALAVAEAEQALAQAAADQDAAAQAAAAQALAQAAAEQAAAETAAAAAQAAAAQAAAAQAAVDQAAAEAAAAQAAAAQAAAEQALADAAAQAILDAGLVSTGYTAEEFASISAAAESLGISLSEFQATGVHIIDFLTQLAGGYEIVVPLTDPPDANGPESVTSTWDEQARDVIGRVSTGYGATEAEAQKFGAFLLTFFVALSGG